MEMTMKTKQTGADIKLFSILIDLYLDHDKEFVNASNFKSMMRQHIKKEI